ncbi:MAG: hypothetical protein IT430_14150 [Phycisphaerales bacterium]|nr:hypothetical protein [Phycisphaerales bacterium]
MSVFTSLVTDVLTVPNTEQTITIRKLAPKHLEEARRASQERAFEDMKRTREVLPPEMLAGLLAKSEKADTPKEKPDPLLTHDRVTLMQRGVTAWSFAQPLTPDSFEDLDDDTADWLAGAILRLSKPSLYAAEDAAQKNG